MCWAGDLGSVGKTCVWGGVVALEGEVPACAPELITR